MILNNFFQDPLENINVQNRKSSRQQKMYVKKSSLKRIGSAVSKKGPTAQQQNDKSLNKLLGLKSESIADKYFSMSQKQKDQKRASILDNYNELDEMIHNYLYPSNQQQQIHNIQQTPIQQGILTAKTSNTFQFHNEGKFNRTSSKNLLLSQNYMHTYGTTTGGILVNTVSEKTIKNWNQSQNEDYKRNEAQDDESESQSNLESCSNPSYINDEKSKHNKGIYKSLTGNTEYNFTNNQTTNAKEDNKLSLSKKISDDMTTSSSKNNNLTSIIYHQGNGYVNSKQSNGQLNQDNSSNTLDNNTLDNNTTNNTLTIRSSKLNSTPSNATNDPSTPSYAMGTIVSNNKTNHARRFSRTRPVTAAISKDSGQSSIKPWLRHELFTKKQKGELINEFEERSQEDNCEIISGDEENSHSKSNSIINDKNRKYRGQNSSHSNQDFEDCTDLQKFSNKERRRKTDDMSKTTGGFMGYNKLFNGDSNKFNQNTCDNIIRDCENLLNKIQKRDGQQLYNSQRKENQIFGQSSQQQKDSRNQFGQSLRNSIRASSSISRPQSVKKIGSNNLFGELGLDDEVPQQEDDIMTLQKIANTLLQKKLAIKENINDTEESPYSVKKDKNLKGSSTTTGSGQRFQISSYPHRQYQKENESNLRMSHHRDNQELSQIQEQQEGDIGLNNDQTDNILQKSTPNIYKKSNSLPRSQSSAKQGNGVRFYDVNDKLNFTEKKEKLTQEALKAAAAIAKNVQKFSGQYSNNNQNAILQRPESKRQSTTGAVINMSSTATGAVSTATFTSNLLVNGALKRNSDAIDKRDQKENIKFSGTAHKNQQNNDQQNKNEDTDEKRNPLQISNKQSRPATAAISKSGSTFTEMSSSSNMTTNKLMERYDIKSTIGKGSYAVVKLAKDTHTDKNVAIKMYDKYKLIDPQKRNNVKREIGILNKFDHINIIKLYQTVDTRSSVNLVMEYISSQSLRQFMKGLDGRILEERIAKTIFKQLVSAVQYCHEWEVIHRDIKLENVMLDVNNNYQIKLIDFGFAIRIPAEKKLNIFCGTPSYMSPEITKKREYFGKPADIWSLGVVLYALICGRFPFKGKDDNDLFRKIQSGDYKISSNSGQSAAKLINKLLRQNPNERPTAKEILQDRWFME